MLTFRTGAAGAPTAAAAMAAYLTEATVPTREAQLAAYYAQDRGTEEGLILGMGTVPTPRQDVDPLLALALGIEPGRALSISEFAYVLQGRRADGSEWPGAARPHVYAAQEQDGVAVGQQRHAIAYIDLTFSAPKSVSVAWAFAPEAERQSIAEAHRAARDETLAYIEREVAKATLGHGTGGPIESGRLAWVSCDHYTSRPTVEIVRPDPLTGTIATELYAVPGSHEIAGDPQLHSHNIVPNLMLTDSGRLVAISLHWMQHRIHEFGATYQAFLAQNLRDAGMEARLDKRTLMACMPSVPREVAESFSKRSRDSATAARERAQRDGLDWDTMDGAARVRWLKASAHATRKPKAAELADVFAWRAQADALGFKPATFQTYGPPEAVNDGERLRRSYAAALPMFADELVTSAVLDGSDARLAAARGLIEHGIKATADIDAVTRLMVREGVEQDGGRTRLLWGVANDGRVRITTELHKDQEEELISLAREAAADMRLSLFPARIDAAIQRSSLNFNTEHGQAQQAAIKRVGQQGGLAVMIGAAGVGKSASAAVLVDAWTQAGYEVWGTALAWRQATSLAEAGIKRDHLRALDPFLRGVHAGRITLTDRSVIVLDEVGQIGTRQLLDLLRLRAETGAKLVAMGDHLQCQAQPLDAHVLTPTGWRLMGDLAFGETVTCPDGTVALIKAIVPQGKKRVFRVSFSDGRYTECCGDHLWKVWKEQNVYSRGPHATRKVINRGDRWHTLPLSEIKRWFDKGLVRSRHAAIPLSAPFALNMPRRDLPIPPYALGLLLGDGHFASGIAHYCSADQFLVEALEREMPAYEAAPDGHQRRATTYRLRLRDPGAHVNGKSRGKHEPTEDYVRAGTRRRREARLTFGGKTQSVMAWAKELGLVYATVCDRVGRLGWSAGQALGLEHRPDAPKSYPFSPLSIALSGLGLAGTRSHNKFIPAIYKTGSVEQRLKVLRGLLDTDGCVGQGGTYAIYNTTSEQMAKDVRDIALSLGAIAHIASNPPTLGGSIMGKPISGRRRYYRVNISHPYIKEFFLLPRKVASTKPSRNMLRLRITSIEPVGCKETQCITVDHPDGLYLTDNYIVTHNSIEAGPTVDLLRKALGSDAIPEIFTTVRQQTEREREIAGMFRRGEVAQAIAAKRRDGTAELVDGGYHEAVRRVAALYREQREAAPGLTVTISAPTNYDAREVSREVRDARRAMGEVGKKDRVTVLASDGRGDEYQLWLAEGDRVRLFQRIRATFESGKVANIGDNGSILTVAAVVPGEGLRLRGESGKTGFVAWRDLRHRGSDRIALTYGDCLTIDTSQGMTSDVHIHALPSGSGAVSGFKNYVAATRHRVRSFMVASMGAELRGAIASRPLGLPEPKGGAAQDEAWAHVVRNLSRTSPKESALAMLASLAAGRRRATQALQAGLRAQEAWMRNGVRSALGRRLRQGAAVRAAESAVPQIDTQVAALLQELEPALRMYGTGVALGAAGLSETMDRVMVERVLPAIDANPALDDKLVQIEAAVSDRLTEAAEKQVEDVRAASARLAAKHGPRLSA